MPEGMTQLQGTLQVTLRNSASGAPLDDNEVRRKFQQFGDVKGVRSVGDRDDSKYVEFYDTRACEEAFDRLRHQGLQDGVMDIVLAWDPNDAPQGQPRVATGTTKASKAEEEVAVAVEVAEGAGAVVLMKTGTEASMAATTMDVSTVVVVQGEEVVDNMMMIMDTVEVGEAGTMTAMTVAEVVDMVTLDLPRPKTTDPLAAGMVPPLPRIPTLLRKPLQQQQQQQYAPDDRLEQARKVQQLLAALKQPQSGAPPAAPAGMPPAGMPGMPPMQPTPNGYYGPTPPYPGAPPPHNPYSNGPSQSSTPQPGPPPAVPGAAQTLNGLPPNILALLQNAQQQRPPQPQPTGYGMPPPQMMNGSVPPAPPMGSNPAAHAQYQQLMSFLVSGGVVSFPPRNSIMRCSNRKLRQNSKGRLRWVDDYFMF
ncbi:hypothetical protein H0H81_012217 [Sphagnurus paluster]|uniref:RRM domain-containing protein n=1 Tax=Sphagnurus paluster TaxID=117069 RepID=A0A9P7FYB3_9AGAR|nr:hypothetical protein H0H81_012217 [Sphagnurus paluster]